MFTGTSPLGCERPGRVKTDWLGRVQSVKRGTMAPQDWEVATGTARSCGKHENGLTPPQVDYCYCCFWEATPNPPLLGS